MRTGSRDISLAIITIRPTIVFSLVLFAVVIIVLSFVFFLHGCLYDEIRMYKGRKWTEGSVVNIP